MRVLATADTVGGVWTYALELARALSPYGVETALATMGAPLTPEQWEEARAIDGLTIFESAYKLEWMPDPWDDVRAAGDWLIDLENNLQPDIVHLNGYAHGTLPWRAPVVMVGHSCVSSWWRAVKGEDAPPSWETYRRAVSNGLAAADMVLAPTRAMLLALQEHYGALSRTGVVYNARDAALFSPSTKAEKALAAGRLWDEAKNIAALASVAADLPWPVQVAGDARHPNGEERTPENVELLGYLPGPALRAEMARAAVYALPARYEPFGLSVLEAGLCGCALVLGDIASLREVWGDAALYVRPDDTSALREALRSLMANPALRASLAAKARARALTYTPERMASGYLEVYRALLPEGSARQEMPACAS